MAELAGVEAGAFIAALRIVAVTNGTVINEVVAAPLDVRRSARHWINCVGCSLPGEQH
jgi:hypothetical protein